MRYVFFTVFLSVLLGCSAGNGENVPDDNSPPPVDEPTGDLLNDIQASIFTPFCTECHAGSNAPFGLSLESPTIAFQNLVGVDAVGDPSFKLVSPNDADNSFLLLKIIGDPRAGRRMPLGRAALGSAQIDLVRNWIEQGAEPATTTAIISKVSHVTTRTDTSSKKYLTIFFDSPIDTNALDNSSVMVYQKIDSGYLMLSNNDFSTHAISKLAVEVAITPLFRESKNPTFKLVINDPNSYPIVNSIGFALDGNNNNQEGGRFEKVIQF